MYFAQYILIIYFAFRQKYDEAKAKKDQIEEYRYDLSYIFINTLFFYVRIN
jgi:hypothetical protein